MTDYTKRDLDDAMRRTRIHAYLETSSLALQRAHSEAQHSDFRCDHPTGVGRFKRISELLGELKEIMLVDAGPDQ